MSIWIGSKKFTERSLTNETLAAQLAIDGLSVGGSLDLSGTQITSLPESLSVGGSLDLSGTQITSLPEGLSVGGLLDLSGTQITSLPEGLKGKAVY